MVNGQMIWLVVSTPPKNHGVKVSWDMDKNHVPNLHPDNDAARRLVSPLQHTRWCPQDSVQLV